MARLRSAPAAQHIPASSQTTRQVLKEKTNTARSQVPVYENDGDADDLVKDARPKRGRGKKAAQNEDELVMAGGLGPARKQRETLLATDQPVTTDELVRSDRTAHSSAKREARKSSVATGQARKMGAVNDRSSAARGTQGPAGSLVSPAQPLDTSSNPLRGRSSRLTAHRPPETLHDRPEFSLSPSPPPSDKAQSVKTNRTPVVQPSSGLKAQSTPSLEHSMAALKNFKRRPRQPSMLQMVQQRTASARPSAVYVRADQDPSMVDLIDDFDDFAPDAEGTPLHLSRIKKLAVASKDISKPSSDIPPSASEAGGARKRKSNQLETSSSSVSAPSAKRQRTRAAFRANTADLDLASSPPSLPRQPTAAPSNDSHTRSSERPASNEGVQSGLPDVGSEIADDADMPAEGPVIQVAATQQPITREHDTHVQRNNARPIENQYTPSDTMAEPVSSSPIGSPRVQSQPTDLAVEPLTQPSPPAKRGRTGKEAKSKPMTTATLQSLLPKRRQPLRPRQRASAYDFEFDSNENDEDEAVNPEGDDEPRAKRHQRRSTTKARAKTNKPSTALTSKAIRRKGAPLGQTAVAAKGRKSTAASKSGKSSKTYSRSAAATSDKENQDEAGFESLDEDDESALPDTSISMIEAAQSKELEEARRKFAEVDDWDMEYESMSIEEGRSSSQNWR